MYHPESECVRKSNILPCEPVFLLIVVVSQPVHLVSLCPLLSLSTFMSQPICHMSLYPLLKFLKELNRPVTFYSSLLYFLNSSLSELLK